MRDFGQALLHYLERRGFAGTNLRQNSHLGSSMPNLGSSNKKVDACEVVDVGIGR